VPPFFFPDVDFDIEDDIGTRDDRSGNVGRSFPHGIHDDGRGVWARADAPPPEEAAAARAISFATIDGGSAMRGTDERRASRNTASSYARAYVVVVPMDARSRASS
jgi:hypothetical protein